MAALLGRLIAAQRTARQPPTSRSATWPGSSGPSTPGGQRAIPAQRRNCLRAIVSPEPVGSGSSPGIPDRSSRHRVRSDNGRNLADLTEQPGVSVDTMLLLLTDGTVIAHVSNSPQWRQLTPDDKGSYTTGTWSDLTPMPPNNVIPASIGGPTYGPLFFASAVLGDGTVLVASGEYNSGPGVTAAAADVAAATRLTRDLGLDQRHHPGRLEQRGDAPLCGWRWPGADGKHQQHSDRVLRPGDGHLQRRAGQERPVLGRSSSCSPTAPCWRWIAPRSRTPRNPARHERWAPAVHALDAAAGLPEPRRRNRPYGGTARRQRPRDWCDRNTAIYVPPASPSIPVPGSQARPLRTARATPCTRSTRRPCCCALQRRMVHRCCQAAGQGRVRRHRSLDQLRR